MYLKDNQKLIDRIKLKQQLLARGDDSHREIRLLYMFEGGTMSGVFAGGVGVGMLESAIPTYDNSSVNLFDTADVLIGCSAGLPPILYGLSKQSLQGYSIYPEKLVGRRFVNPRRIWKIVDIDYLTNLFRDGEKRLRHDEVLRSRPEVFAVLTHAKTGIKKIVNVKNEKILTLIGSAIKIPLVSGFATARNGEDYIDGLTLPIKNIIKQFRPTDVVLVVNRPLTSEVEHRLGFLDRVVGALIGKLVSKELQHAFICRHSEFRDNVEFLKNLPITHNINVGIIAPHRHHINRFECAADKIRKSGKEGACAVLSLFAPEKQEIVTKQM